MTRWKAAAIHFSISAAIGLIVGALLFGLWYPPPYFHAAGADELILLLVGVDIVLGPLLTLIVFRTGKRGMKFDLWAIGLTQSIALIYGLAVVLESRPVFLVGAIDRFVLVAANEISDADLAKASDAVFATRSWSGPRLAIAELPADPQERSRLVVESMSGHDVQYQPMYFRRYAGRGAVLLQHARTLSELRASRPADAAKLDGWLRDHHREEGAVRWLPVQALKADLVMMLDAVSGEPVGPVLVEPTW
jgi:hypothetical protein